MTGTTYAIGDIHGRLDLLGKAASRIVQHAGGRPDKVVFLGDYVDRGPDSRGVIEVLMAMQQRWDVVCLRGNHEQMMLDALANRDLSAAARWLDNGGRATLESYGGVEGVSPEHLAWMAGLPVSASDALRFYVHAGIMPGVLLADQAEETCLWIRHRFLRDPGPFEKHIVHGHTPTWEEKVSHEPELLAHRTNLDTGAFFTGRLAIAVFAGNAAQPVEMLYVVA